MDTATTVAVFGFLGTLVASIVGAVVAIFTNRTEKQQTAEDSIEKTLRERIVLKEEIIRDRDETIQELRADLEWEKKRKPCTECILLQNLNPEEKPA